MGSSCKLFKTGSDFFFYPTLYRLVVGTLQYATLTRHDISYVATHLKSFGQLLKES